MEHGIMSRVLEIELISSLFFFLARFSLVMPGTPKSQAPLFDLPRMSLNGGWVPTRCPQEKEVLFEIFFRTLKHVTKHSCEFLLVGAFGHEA